MIKYYCLLLLCIDSLIHANDTPLTANECRAAVNPDIEIKDTIEHAVACMIAGYKEVYWGTQKELAQPAIQEKINQSKEVTINTMIYSDVPRIGEPDYHHCILYTDNGERNAFLLAKYLLERELTKYVSWLNSYTLAFNSRELTLLQENACIMGRSLGYSDQDIKFFYQLNALKNSQLQWNAYAWTKEEKKLFHQEITKDKSWEFQYKKDTEGMNNWMGLNEGYTTDVLKTQVNSLNQAVQSFYPQRERPMVPQAQMQNKIETTQKTPWLKKVGIGVAFAGAAAAITALWHKYWHPGQITTTQLGK
jgi:hypothetical protein